MTDSINTATTVQVVQRAYEELLDFVTVASTGTTEMNLAELQREVETTLLALMAAVVLSDGELGDGEAAFLVSLLNVRDLPGGAVRYLNEYASRWPALSTTVPRFYSMCVSSSPGKPADEGRHIRQIIQFIGNNASITDGKFAARENEIVRNYIGFLENYSPE